MEEVRKFYSAIRFPGLYSIDDLSFYDNELINPYLKMYDDTVKDSYNVLDVGCGSGFIVNFLARRHPKIHFDAVDFSDSIDYARGFSRTHNIKNITYYKEDFLKWHNTHIYDCVICNGVLHHMPRYVEAVNKIKALSTNKLTVGLYNSYGKLAKKLFKVAYKNDVLYMDQEQCPFELSFSDSDAQALFNDVYTLKSIYPSCNGDFVNLMSLFNYKKGGLVVYSWVRKH